MRSSRPGSAEEKLSFSGHETFVFRYGWLKKAVDAIRDRPGMFTSEEAMVALGVGKNMVRSIRHWALATRVLEEQARTRGAQLKATALGELLFGPAGSDPFLEDVNTLWILHWNLATNEERSTVCCWAFSLLPSNEFTRQSLTAVVRDELRRRNLKEPSESSLGRDIDCFIHTYAAANPAKRAVLEDTLDCPLAELGIIEEDAVPGLFLFQRGAQPNLADEVFAHALIDFWDRVGPKRETLAFSEVAYGFASPGMVFRLDEDSLSERLDRLDRATRGRLVYTETAGLKQIYRRRHISSVECLKQYCKRIEQIVPIGA